MSGSIRKRLQKIGQAMGRHPDAQIEPRKIASDLKDPKKVIRLESCSSLPITDRTVNRMDADKARSLLLVCRIGERVNLSHVQVLVMNRIFHDRLAPLDYASWIGQLFNFENGVMRKKYRDAKQASHIYNMFETEQRPAAEDNYNDIQAVIEDDRYLLMELAGVNPRRVSWERLVEMGLRPKTASFWSMRVRPCENVCLTGLMLQWAHEVPEILHPGRQPEKASYRPLPQAAPHCEAEYQKAEYRVRRRQRVYFPGLTSLECEGIIYAAMLNHLR